MYRSGKRCSRYVRRFFSLVLSSSIILSSCVATNPPAFDRDELSPQKIYYQLDRQFRSMTSFRGDATITIDTPKQSGQVRSEVIVESDDQAEIILRSPFGGKVGRLVIRRSYLLFYNADDNLQYVGSPDNTGIPALPQLFTGEQNLVSLLTGQIEFPADFTESLVSDSVDNAHYQLTFQTDTTSLQYWYDPTVSMITRYVETQIQTRKKTVIEFEKFTNVDGLQLPRSIRITQPGERRMLAIYYHSVNISRENTADVL